ncbi:MAG: ABC transporter ATP-binding protein [Bacteroidales bacterium]|nr:ABC transporter ATP-binding protein [Bacteroidales bacterium]
MLLQVENLTVAFGEGDARHEAVHGVSFAVERGRTLAIVGESGSGKSVSTLCLMGLLPATAHVSGHAWFKGSDNEPAADLLTMTDEQLRHVRGKRIAMIFQEPMTSLNPLQRCGRQVAEMLQLHEGMSRREARSRTVQLFKEVMLPRPEKIYRSYPHEISGGQKQRVMIAMAMACHPDILIADEPTTALDVTVQQGILRLMRQLQERHGVSIIFISHDLGVVAQVADEVAVMYHGNIVEQGSAASVLHNPQHPYTQGLLACRPPLQGKPRRLPTLDNPHPTTDSNETAVIDYSREPLLSVRNLSVRYPLRKSLLGRTLEELTAVDGVSFDLFTGETLGLVGESGCGKTTLGRALLRLINSQSERLAFHGTPLNSLGTNDMRRLRQKIQIVFQDPYSSLNPRLTVGQAVSEPLMANCGLPRRQAIQQAAEMLEQVGLEAAMIDRYPHEFSGGQRQRICIARALVMQPELVVCDESVSALDVSVQAQVLNLLNELKERHHYTYLFITHDLSVVHYMADRIIVMQQGRIVEQGASDELFANPQHEYTRTLLSAIPRL